VDSELLSELAIDGSGAYAFIPDAGFVGTVFVNSMSNLLVTMAKDATLTLQPQNGASFVGTAALGGHPQTLQAGGELSIRLGPLQYGQSKDVVVMLSVPPAALKDGYLQATLEYSTIAGVQPPVHSTGIGRGDPTVFPAVEQQRLRLLFVDAVRTCVRAAKLSTTDRVAGKPLPLPGAQALVLSVVEELRSSPEAASRAAQGLLEDAEGQVAQALSREDWYTKWGIHYLPSLMFAHLTQQCNNFKDAGVQDYGGELFNTVREAADEIFLALPAPQKSANPPQGAPMPSSSAPSSAPSYSPPAVSMSAYYDACAG